MGNKRAETVKDTEALSVQRCDTWEWQNMRPATFFAAYARCGVPSASAADPEPPLLKLKDYPPSAGFASVLPRHLQVCPRHPRRNTPSAHIRHRLQSTDETDYLGVEHCAAERRTRSLCRLQRPLLKPAPPQ